MAWPVNVVLFVSGIFTAIYLVAGLIFMYLPIEEITFPLILFVSVTVLYVIAAALSMHGAGYIGSTEKEVKDKRLFIKLLEADVLDCMEKASEESSKDLLKRLAEDIKYSDPMSHPSLMGIEAELSATVGNISLQLSEDPAKDVTSSVSKAQTLLKSRNNRCIMLK